MFSGGHLLSVLIFFPAFGALALLFLRGDDHVWIRRLAFTVSLAEFLLSLLLIPGVPLGSNGYRLEEFIKWIDVPPINYHLGVDGISLFLVILTSFLTLISVAASWKSIDHRVKEFFVMLLMLEVGVIGVFLALDLFLFFLFWEVMLIPMYFLIGIWGHERRIYAAVKFVLYTMAGSILMLVGIIWLYNASGTFDLPTIQQMLQTGVLTLTTRAETLLFLAFFVAFAIKVPLFPFHTWLPDAHVEAPTAGSVILAGVLLKMGTYGMIRFCLPLFPDASRRFAPAVAVLAIIGVIYGALVALVQPNLKRFCRSRHFYILQHLHAGRCVPNARARSLHRRAVSARWNALRPAAHFRDYAIRRPCDADAAPRRILPVRSAVFAWPANAQWFCGRIPDSSRHLSSALDLGGMGRFRSDSIGLLSLVGVPAGLFR